MESIKWIIEGLKDTKTVALLEALLSEMRGTAQILGNYQYIRDFRFFLTGAALEPSVSGFTQWIKPDFPFSGSYFDIRVVKFICYPYTNEDFENSNVVAVDIKFDNYSLLQTIVQQDSGYILPSGFHKEKLLTEVIQSKSIIVNTANFTSVNQSLIIYIEGKLYDLRGG